MNKTAMQIVYEYADTMGSDEFCMTMIKMRTELLAKEKEQIETAYLAGWGNSSDYHGEHKEEITDEQYFAQTYQKQK